MEVINSIGRRKSAVARVYLSEGTGTITVNKVDSKQYFAVQRLVDVINKPFKVLGVEGQYDVKVNLDGGGVSGQAEALSLGIARALVKVNEENKPALRKEGLLTRDARVVERKKPGQPGARKKFQFSKR